MRAAALALLLAGSGQASGAVPQSPTEALSILVNAQCFDGARVGAVVLDLADGRCLAEHDADFGFMTASNMKLITAAAALVTLGPERRFRTTLVSAATVRDGVLYGDLLLRGDGDPTLGGAHEATPTAPFERMAAELVRRGIRAVTGEVLGLDHVQAEEPLGEGWSWGYESEPYAAPASGLCFAENCVEVVLWPAAPGAPPTARVWPPAASLSLSCEARCSANDSTPSIQVERLRASPQIVVRGRLPSSSGALIVKVAVDNPTSYAASALREVLARAGVRVQGIARDADDLDATAPGIVLAEQPSPKVVEILTQLNKVSQNLYGEQLIRAASRYATGRGDMAGAAAHAQATLRGLGVDTTGMVIADGSGLSRLNQVRPRQLATLLAAMWHSPHREAFANTLPIAGVDGTLQNRLRGSAAHGRVRAKTGYISRVVALSGYVPRPDPQLPPLVFSVLTNNFTCETEAAKTAVDAFVNQLARTAGWAEPGR